MIACILAGGEGTRLRPISCRNPKPMTKLLTHPVLGHMLTHLHACGIDQAAVTLRHMPDRIRDYFGNGEDWGVRLEYFEETQPLGTAGGVANCTFPEGEEILVVSGDAVCDFDFREALAFHRSSAAEATILLSRQNEPLEYGIVECAPDGRVERFVEKPAWNRVSTDTVNTGIYILSPSVVRRIARGKASDFSRDIFPEMLRRGDALYAFAAEGYWCDIGDCGAYLRCVHDALAGRIRIELPRAADGICTLSEIPGDVEICPPVYIGRDVRIGRDARIGPYTVLDDGASVGRGAVIEGSILRGSAGENTSMYQAIAERASRIEAWSSLGAGAVLGEGVHVGEHTEVRPGVRIWPDCDTGSDTVVRFNMNAIGRTHRLRFSADAACEGALGCDLTPEFGASLGSALASVCAGAVGCACDGSPAAEAFLQAVLSGIRVCGERAVVIGAQFASQAAFAARQAGYGLSVFVGRCGTGLWIRLFSGDGMCADESIRRKIENLLASGDYRRAGEEEVGSLVKNDCAAQGYCRACLEYGRLSGKSFRVGEGPAAAQLCNILWLMGARIEEDAAPAFLPSADGLSLEAQDEDGRMLDDAHTLACAFYAAQASLPGKEAVCPDDAPEILAQIAAGFGKQLIRPHASARARDLLAQMPYLHDGVMRAAFLAAFLARENSTLAALAARLPLFDSCREEIPLHCGRAAFMRAARQAGLHGAKGNGGIRFAPSCQREALTVYAESHSMEAARELCTSFCEQAKRLDTDLKRQKIRD